jgi:hypothetical protein
VKAAAKRDKLLKVIREGAGSLDMSRHPEWSTSEKVVQWVRDLRDTPSIRSGDPIDRVLAGFRRANRLAEGKTPRSRTSRAPRKRGARSSS